MCEADLVGVSCTQHRTADHHRTLAHTTLNSESAAALPLYSIAHRLNNGRVRRYCRGPTCTRYALLLKTNATIAALNCDAGLLLATLLVTLQLLALHVLEPDSARVRPFLRHARGNGV